MSDQPDQPIPISKFVPKLKGLLRRHLKIILVVVGVLVIIAAALGVVEIYYAQTRSKVADIPYCKGATFETAREAITRDDQSALEPIVTKMKTDDKNLYTKNFNCMYLATEYELLGGNVKGAVQQFNQLQKVYQSHGRLNTNAVPTGSQIIFQQLQTTIKAVQQNKNHFDVMGG